MVFLHFFAFGSVIPILSLYLLKNLGFAGSQVGMILAAGSISSILSPLVSTFIADKIISSERMFAIAHLFGSIIMISLYFSASFTTVFILYLLYMAFIGPTMPLADTIIFHHLSDRKKYGNIRVWGTFGWISTALFFGFFIMQRTGGDLSNALILSAIASFFLGLFAFTIPKTNISETKHKSFLPVKAFRILVQPKVLILVLSTFLVFFADRFYFFGSSPYLKSVGFPEKFIMPYLSIGQILEIGAMISLTHFMVKFRAKTILIAGILVNMLRYALLTFFSSKLMTLLAVACHGVAYTLFFSTVFILLDFQTEKESRAGVHQLFRIVYLGFGTLLGNLVAGHIKEHYVIDNEYKLFWMVPAVIMGIVFIVMLFFPDKKKA